MNKLEVIRFFRLLGRLFHEPCLVILTGAAAGAIYGRVRATLDLDFALKFKAKGKRRKEKAWQDFSKVVSEVEGRTGIVVQYAEDIDRWSPITFLDYEHHTRRFDHFGKIEVRLLEPAYWAIGKLARYLDLDIRDLIRVLRRTKTSWKVLARVLGLALHKSPRSTSCFLFRRQVEDFFSTYGRIVWGKNYSPEKAIRMFHRYGEIKDR